MIKILEIDNCTLCCHYKTRNGDHMCGFQAKELKPSTFGKINIPSWCPLPEKDDYLEANFDADRT